MRSATPLGYISASLSHRVNAVKKLFVFIGSTGGSYLGWWLGTPGGVFGSFVVSMVGLGAGMWAGARLADHFGG